MKMGNLLAPFKKVNHFPLAAGKKETQQRMSSDLIKKERQHFIFTIHRSPNEQIKSKI
jgi:hypothetical protein